MHTEGASCTQALILLVKACVMAVGHVDTCELGCGQRAGLNCRHIFLSIGQHCRVLVAELYRIVLSGMWVVSCGVDVMPGPMGACTE